MVWEQRRKQRSEERERERKRQAKAKFIYKPMDDFWSFRQKNASPERHINTTRNPALVFDDYGSLG